MAGEGEAEEEARLAKLRAAWRSRYRDLPGPAERPWPTEEQIAAREEAWEPA